MAADTVSYDLTEGLVKLRATNQYHCILRCDPLWAAPF